MEKTKKALASLVIAGMALTMVPFNAFATGTIPTRLAGTTAAQTAVAIADQTGWTGTAILASSASYGMVDALTAGPLASYLKAPILLTGAGNVLDTDTKAELVKLAVTKVYVTSGTAVIGQGVLTELAGMNIEVVPLGGFDRAATSVNIASKMVGVTKIAVANGLQDALSIAAIASAANEPILLTDKDTLPASVKAYISANPAITSGDVIGGTGVISDNVKATVPSAIRHAGNTAYDTNNQVIQDFASSLDFGNVFVANGITAIDALAGAPLAAQTKSAIVLTDGTVPTAAAFVNSKLKLTSSITALGGAAVVPDGVRDGFINAVPAAKTYSAGMYKIGSDMPAGEYVLIASDQSYFEVDKDSTGQLDSILANDNFSNRTIISVSDGQYLKMTDCVAYAFQDAPKVQPVGGFLSDGMYKVGIDLPAGEYKVTPVGDAYVEVSSDSSHSLNSIITNDNFKEERYITVTNGQYLRLNSAKITLN